MTNPQRGFVLPELRHKMEMYPGSYRLVRGPKKSGLWWTVETDDELRVDIIAVAVIVE